MSTHTEAPSDATPQQSNAPRRNENNGLWFSTYSKPLIFLIVAFALAGGYLAFSIPVAVFPSTNFPRIVIGVDNGVMPIDQMLVTITRPVEEEVTSIPGLQQIRSITSRGSDEIDLAFDWRVDMLQTLQYANTAITRVQSLLPPEATVTVNRLTFASFPIMGYSLTSDTIPQTQLWEIATYEIKPRLNRLNGVSSVVVQGGQEPEFQIMPDPARLLISKVTVQDLLDAVRRTNLIESPGLLERNHQLVLGLVNGQVRSSEQIGDIVIKQTAGGVPVSIRDVATVGPSVRPVYTTVTAQGQPAVLLSLNRQPNSNTIQVADEVHAEVESIRKTLPSGADLRIYYDQSTIVGQSIKSVRDAILIGLVLASIILVVFLRDWGTSLVAGLVIPVTILITFIVLRMLGQTFNLMTLGGLAAAVGLVIDDAIVVVENIVLHRNAGQHRMQAIQSALREITGPLIGSTVTPVVVFLPLIFITGVTGVFFRAMALTMAISLFTSLALALTWTPTLSQYLIKEYSGKANIAETAEAKPTPEQEIAKLQAAEDASLTGFFKRVVNFYERWLQRALEKPRWVLLLCVALILASFFCYRYLGTDLLPGMDEGNFIIDYIMPAGSSLAETNRVVSHIEEFLRQIPEVENTSRRTGLQLGLATVTEANTGDISVKLKDNRSRGIDEIISEVRAQIAREEPALQVEFVQSLQDMIGDLSNAPEPVQIKLFSPNPELLQAWAIQVGDAIRMLPGVVDVLNGIDNAISGPALMFQVEPDVVARAGFTPEEISTDARALLQGEPAATPLVVNDQAYTMRVRFPEANRASLEAMRDTLLVSSTGNTATLGALTNLSEMPGQTEIRRENLQRSVAVTARFEGVDLGTGIKEVKRAVAALHVPPSIRIEYGGTYQEQQRSFHDLLEVLILAIALVFIVLLFEFRVFAAPVAILSSTLLSTSGIFAALLITGTTFNISSFMGIIMVIGIVAKNGILLLDAEQKFRKSGLSPHQAMVEAGRRRLRPIVMTALATVAGMMPLAFALGAGSQMLQPLAIAVIGGVVVSMVLSLIVTPTVYRSMTKRPHEQTAG
jgi:CzcA family heavy metal efflux pump